ncbi:hypothetical protein [Chitinophaga barathri]|uniref:Uncharacterized protein n=1 Tax=Chitinophaga barathri TaxID=1647451 RepID=A0A3N4MDS3_9BACT|nr:hypothetical protein [Chitinophaga barathri]RPD41901.1 hypothetical protein EG028_06990 [Chitinophaga barathri]
MAKQMSVIKITGTIGNITFYKMKGEYYARGKSSLSRKRVKTAPEFARLRVYSRRMACASGAAGRIYRSLRIGEQDVTFYRKMVSEGLRLLKAGCAEEQLEEALREIFLPAAAEIVPPDVKETPVPHTQRSVAAVFYVNERGRMEINDDKVKKKGRNFKKMPIHLRRNNTHIPLIYEIKAHSVIPADVDDLRQCVFPDS